MIVGRTKITILLEKVFSLFGNSILGKMVAATLIGGLLPLLFQNEGKIPEGQLGNWCLGFASIGFLAALLFTLPNLIFGIVQTLVGGLLVCLPISNGDGQIIRPMEYFIPYFLKAIVGLVIMIQGGYFLLRIWKRHRSPFLSLNAQQADSSNE